MENVLCVFYGEGQSDEQELGQPYRMLPMQHG